MLVHAGQDLFPDLVFEILQLYAVYQQMTKLADGKKYQKKYCS
jgi:hypothetical protein